MALDAGTRLGPYEVLGLIGAGGMGEVYQARDTRLDRAVAIKVLPHELASDPERRTRFEREARTISTLNHPHICTLHDVGEANGQAFLVMEHLVGETLAEQLKKGPLPLAQALTVATEIADALAAAHRQGIIHRDLKPGNVMLTKAGAKLLDFGLAKLTGHGEQPAAVHLASATRSTPLTGAGVIVGTLQYMAPEQLEGKPADARTDLWALGAMLYEMVTGKRAFEGSSAASLITAIMSTEITPVSTLQPLTPPSLERIVQKCLAKSPDDRWDSAHDVADELRWIGHSGGSARTTSLSGRAQGVRWVVGAVLALVALALGATVLWWSGIWRRPSAAPGRSGITSIAVLPLENLSGDPGQEYFADGMTDSLINELAQIRSLRVISRTSVMRYKGARKPLREIAHELNDVGAIVEGTVTREAGRVAVSVQLIDTASDAHLWSQSYDRDLTNILTLRREIARKVAQEIRAAIAPDEERRLARRETVNPAAYEWYLRSLDLRRQGDTADSVRASLDAARQAVTLDPSFAEAFAALAEASARLWWYHWDRSPERMREARQAADKALALDPELSAAHRAKGSVHYFLDLDYARALDELSSALQRNPSDSYSLALTGYVRRRQGRPQETVAYLEQARALDPLDATVIFNLGETHALMRQPDDAERCYTDALKLHPAYNRSFAYRLRWRLRLRPELAQAREVEREANAAGLGADSIVRYHRVLLHMYAGDHTEALGLLADKSIRAFEDQFWFAPVPLLQAQILDRLGQRVRARERYAEARRVIETKLAEDPNDSRVHSALGLVLAGLGEKDAAIRAGRAGIEAMPVDKEAYRGAYRLEDLARIYSAVGEHDTAVDLLGRLLAMPTDLAAPALALDPGWGPLHNHPGFKRLVGGPGVRALRAMDRSSERTRVEACPSCGAGRWRTTPTFQVNDVTVRPYPDPGPRSLEGGANPAWHPSGSELFLLESSRSGRSIPDGRR